MAKGATAAEVVGTMKGFTRARGVRSRALRFAVTSDVTSGGGNSLRSEVVSWFDGRLRIP